MNRNELSPDSAIEPVPQIAKRHADGAIAGGRFVPSLTARVHE